MWVLQTVHQTSKYYPKGMVWSVSLQTGQGNPRGLQKKSAVNSSWLLIRTGHRSLLLNNNTPYLGGKIQRKKINWN